MYLRKRLFTSVVRIRENKLFMDPQKNVRGIFVVFEGIDGCGKSTQVQRLTTDQYTYFPIAYPNYENSCGKHIRNYLTKERNMRVEESHVLFSNNRWEDQEMLRARLLSPYPQSIACDRYSFSGIAYSASKGMCWEDCVKSDQGMIAPDVVFYLVKDPEYSLLQAKCAGAGATGTKDLHDGDIELQKKVKRYMDAMSS